MSSKNKPPAPAPSSALARLAQRSMTNPLAAKPDSGGTEIPLDRIVFDPTQPRTSFHHPDGRISDHDLAMLEELAASIETHGQIQAISVEELPDGKYMVLVGERRTRAFLHLKRKTIRAHIVPRLANSASRLIYRLAENVNRDDLVDGDLAMSIQRLMKGEGGQPPMTQAAIAKELGKSEGWISRYVKFADEELQRLWVKTGITDTVEHLYRVSILPKPLQVEIQRRAHLDPDDPAYLPTPLSRAVLVAFAEEAKRQKAARRDSPTAPAGPGAGGQAAPTPPGPGGSGGVTADADSVARRFEELAAAGQQGASDSEERSGSAAPSGTKYQLPLDARTTILQQAGATASSDGDQEPVVIPPVNARVPLGTLLTAVQKLGNLEEISRIQVAVALPGALAQVFANGLSGVIVDPKEVPATVIAELGKLQ